MRAAYIKILRWSFIGVIVIVILLVLYNYLYLQIWRNRVDSADKKTKILSSEVARSAESIEYTEYKEGVVRFKIRAKRLLEAKMGRSLLEGIEANDLNPDGSVHNEIRSQNAMYDREGKVVDFSGDVRLFLGKEFELRTNTLHYDLNTNVGTTPDALQLFSHEASGTARGARFDQKQESLDISSEVNLTLIRKRANKSSPAQTEKLHATSEKAFCADAMHRIVFQGKARVESESGILSGDRIEATLSPDRKHITALTCTGNAVYQSREAEETRALNGDSIMFVIGESGVLEKISLLGRAAFSLTSSSEERDLQGGEIDLDIDPASNSLSRIQSRNDVRFRMKRGEDLTEISGDRLDAAMNKGTKNLESVHVHSRAKLSSESSGDEAKNELQADDIRVSFREMNGRAVYEKLRAEGSAKWLSTPKQDSAKRREPSRALTASLLEMIYSGEGDYWESGMASGKVSISENTADQSSRPQVRRLFADSVRFHFFPSNGQLRDMDAEGHVQTTYEKKQSGSGSSAVEKFQTESDNMKAVFALKNGESVAESVAQWGRFSYKDASWTATAGRSDYDAAKGMLILKESPRISGEIGSTTGEQVEYDQTQKMLSVHRKVESILSTKKGEASFFGSSTTSSPGIVTADEMQYWSEAGRSRYTGKVQWLSENQQLQAQILELFEGGERVEAHGDVRHLVTGNVRQTGSQPDKSKPARSSADSSSPVTIQSSGLKYIKESNALNYSGNVLLRSGDLSLSSTSLDATLDQERKNVERATAHGKVLIRQGARECKGETADYYLDPGKYVVVGNPAEVYDPGRGRSFARRLTSFTTDDTILLEQR